VLSDKTSMKTEMHLLYMSIWCRPASRVVAPASPERALFFSPELGELSGENGGHTIKLRKGHSFLTPH
jgi:hypothetical protein